MSDAACVRERSWIADGRWWFERLYADGSRRVACRVTDGPREDDMAAKWGVHTPWTIKQQQKASGDVDRRERIAPRIEALLRQFESADVDVETLAYAAYSLGWGDARKHGRTITPDTASEHTPEVQS